MGKNTSIVRIPSSINGKFFKFWLEFLKPLHKLTNKETEFLAEMLKQRFLITKIVKDDEMVDTLLFSDEIKSRVMGSCGISSPHFNVLLTGVRKAGIIVNNKINKKFIPNIDEDAKDFSLIIHFEIKE